MALGHVLGSIWQEIAKKSVKKDQNAAFQPLFGGVLLRILCMKEEESEFCVKLQFPAL